MNSDSGLKLDRRATLSHEIISEYRPKVIDIDQINEIKNIIDADGNGQIEYSEFLAHSLTKDHVSEQNVRVLFNDIIKTYKLQITYEAQ